MNCCGSLHCLDQHFLPHQRQKQMYSLLFKFKKLANIHRALDVLFYLGQNHTIHGDKTFFQSSISQKNVLSFWTLFPQVSRHISTHLRKVSHQKYLENTRLLGNGSGSTFDLHERGFMFDPQHLQVWLDRLLPEALESFCLSEAR